MKIEQVTVQYGANIALNNVSIDVEPGSIHAIIGPNGAGKSTLFGAISGEHRVRSGRITVDGGADLTRLSVQARVREAGIVRSFQVARIFSGLTVRENFLVTLLSAQRRPMRFWRSASHYVKQSVVADAADRVRLSDSLEVRADQLAQGDRKRLEIGMALALGARVLLLDEPTAGMSSEETRETAETLASLWSQETLTILLTEHDLDLVFGLARRVTVLNRGQIFCTDAPEAVRANDEVRAMYMASNYE